MVGTSLGIGFTILRYFNVYGPRQALSNPYTGVASTFCSQIQAGKPIEIYEDGLPIRDFVHVRDVVKANLLALERPLDERQVMNVGSGSKVSILDVALAIYSELEVEPDLKFSGQEKMG